MKEFSSKPVYFTYLGFLVLAFSLTFALNMINIRVIEQNSVLYVLLSMIASGLFFYLGSKRRKLVIDDSQIAYYSSNIPFISTWNEVSVIKSFQEMGKNAEHLIIIKEDESILTISSSFFNGDELEKAFIYLTEVAKNHPHINIEDDLNWLNEQN